MTRAALLLVVVAGLLAACGSADKPSGPAGIADVVVRVDPDGARGPKPAQKLHLVCTKPQQSQACGAAAGISAADLRPTPSGVACTDIFGGPQTATIVGVIRGQQVNARFSRTNGCEIKRWNGVSDLLNLVP
jgi:hypothetical protein